MLAPLGAPVNLFLSTQSWPIRCENMVFWPHWDKETCVYSRFIISYTTSIVSDKKNGELKILPTQPLSF